MSDDRRYELRVTFKRNPPSAPDITDGKLLARALRVAAGNIENHLHVPSSPLLGELFDYEHQYGYWNLRQVLEKEVD